MWLLPRRERWLTFPSSCRKGEMAYDRERLRNAAPRQIIAGELHTGGLPVPARLTGTAHALNAMASKMIAGHGQPAGA
jgi:hypothetical protein